MWPPKWRFFVAAILVAVGLVWWFYPRQPPRIWWTGTAPHHPNDRAKRPTVAMPIDHDYLRSAELFVDDAAAGKEPLVLQAGAEKTIRGTLELQHIPPGATLVAVQFGVLSQAKTALGMIAEGMTDAKYVEKPKTTPASRELTTQIRFEQPWNVPDHPGELSLSLEFHLASPGVRDVPRRFALVCPVTITPTASLD